MLPSTSKIDLGPCEGGKQPPLARLQGEKFCGTRNFDIEEGGEECVRSNGGSVVTLSAHRKRMFLHLSEENSILLERIKILEGRQSPQNEAIFISPRMRLRDFGSGVVSRRGLRDKAQDWLTRSSSCPLPSKSTPDFVQRARPNSRKEYVCSVGQEMSVIGRQCTEEIRTAALVLAEIALEMIHAQELGPSSENKSCEVVDRRRYRDDLIDQTDEIVAVLEEEVRGLHRWASIACEHTRVEDGATLHSDQLLGTAISNETIRTPLGENEDCHGSADEIDWPYGASTASSKEAAESEILLNPIILTCRFSLKVALLVAVIMLLIIFWFIAVTRKKFDFIIWIITLSCVLVSLPLTCYDLFLHFYFWRSRLQIYYVSITALAPLYALQAWLAIRFVSSRKYLVFFRELYECLVLHFFLRLLTEFLHSSRIHRWQQAQQGAEPGAEQREHWTPLSALKDPRRRSSVEAKLIPSVKAGVYQYILVRIVFAAVILLLQVVPMQGNPVHDSNTRFLDPAHIDGIYFWDAMATNVSQQLAFSMLAVFITALKRQLQPLNPRSKLAAIVVLCFYPVWQKWGYAFAVYWRVFIPPVWGLHDPAAFENTILAFEMTLIAFLLRKVLSVREFLPSGGCYITAREAAPEVLSDEGRVCKERARLQSEVRQLQGLVAERIKALEGLGHGMISMHSEDETDESEASQNQGATTSFTPSLPRNVSWESLFSSNSKDPQCLSSGQKDPH